MAEVLLLHNAVQSVILSTAKIELCQFVLKISGGSGGAQGMRPTRLKISSFS